MIDNNTMTLLLNLPEIEVQSVDLLKNKIIISCHSILEEKSCPCCLKKVSKVKSETERTVKDLKLIGKEVELKLKSRQFYCENCGKYSQENYSFVSKNSHMTERLEKYLYDCCKSEALEKVAARENVEWNTLNNLFIKNAKKVVASLDEKTYTHLGIDEFAPKKGKKEYATVLVDLKTGVVIDVLNFRTKQELVNYFNDKSESFRSNVEVFSCDMWEGFANTARLVFPNADIVVDRFHFFVHLNKALDNVRKQLKSEFKDYDIFHKIKWSLFKSWDKCSGEQKRLLLRAFKLAPLLRELYFLKNELVNIFNSDFNQEKCEELCEKWIEQATKKKNPFLNIFLKTFQNWKIEILNFFKHHVTNGVVEGINNLIKTLKRQAFGYTNFEHFRLKIIVQFY